MRALASPIARRSSGGTAEDLRRICRVSTEVARQIGTDVDPPRGSADQVMGVSDLMAQAVKSKYIAALLSEGQLRELMQIR
jgi:hypothetical protein